MNGTWRVVVLLLFATQIPGCAATVQSVRTDPSVPLRHYARLAVVMASAAGATSVSGSAIGAAGGAVVGGVVTGEAMDGEAQAMQALESLRFEMAAVGFQMVSNPSKAQLIGEFSIGQVRYDLLAGWIADQAILVFKDPSGTTIASFRAKSGGITSTVDNLISQIAKAVAKDF